MAKRAGRLRRFWSDYTRGMKTRDVKRLFADDAPRAFQVLARDQDLGPEPKGRFKRLIYRSRLLFLGISYKLTPARRLIFGLCVLVTIMGSDHSSSPNGLTMNRFAANWFLSPVEILPNLIRFSAVNTMFPWKGIGAYS